MSNETQQQFWDPTSLFSTNGAGNTYAVILLNQPIAQHRKRIIYDIWRRATLRLCADGGANRLYEAYGDSDALPHEIRGDLDSVRDEVKAFYNGKGVKIVKAASQYATDLQKCLLRVEEAEEAETKVAGSDVVKRMEVVIIGGLSGRFDQTVQTLHVLCQLAQCSKTMEQHQSVDATKLKNKGLDEDDFVSLDRREKTWVLSENSIVWILTKGFHKIYVDLDIFGPTCGLLPFASQVEAEATTGTKIWTEGLEWNLDGTPSAVGSFLSTSNHLKEKTVQVKVDKEIVWTMEIREDDS